MDDSSFLSASATLDYFNNVAATASYSISRYFNEMMTQRQGDSEESTPKKDLLSVSFNQDYTCLAVGHEDGYALYSLRSLENLEKVHEGHQPRRIYIIERLFASSLITLVSVEQSRKLSVYHYQKNNEICCHGYSSAILSVRLNRKRVIVCLEESIHVHNITDMRLLHVIKDTPSNPNGLVDLSSNADNCYLAYPGSATTGHVHIFDADSLSATCGFAAHEGPLAAMAFSPDGKKIATASQKGTVIRVFEVPSGARLFEFTRGMKRCVTIHSLAFSSDSSLLCSSSNTETIHVFSLIRTEPALESQRKEESQEGISSWVNYLSQQATAYLPAHMNELMLREKSLCTARLPMAGTKTVVAIPQINGKYYLFAATSDGYLFCYNLETVPGNECALLYQFRIGPTYGKEESGGLVPLGTTSSENVPAPCPSASSQARLIDLDEPPRHSDTVDSNTRRRSPTSSTGSDHHSSPKQQSPPLTVHTPSPPDGARRAPQSVPFASSPGNSSSSTSGKVKPPVPALPSFNQYKEVNEEKEWSDSDSEGIGSPADLNDLEEFPPLTFNKSIT